MEAELAAGADTSRSPKLPAAGPTPVRALSASALEAAAEADSAEKKSYGKDKDDLLSD